MSGAVRHVLSLWKGRIPVHSLPETAPMLRSIAQRIAVNHALTVEQLRHNDKKKGVISQARQEFIATAYATGRFSTTVIGKFMDGRDHTTIMYHLDKVR